MRIAISTLSHPGQNVWSSGITQNALFLAKLLGRIPFVREVMLLDVGSETSLGPQVDLDWFGTRMIKLPAAGDQVDVIIEMAGLLDRHWLELQRARGKKVIWHIVGNPYSALIEGTLFRKEGFFLEPARHDVIWLIPEYANFESVLRVAHRTPVQVVPYIWDNVFLRQRIAELERHGMRFGYQPKPKSESKAWSVAVFEPNLSATKSGLVPMLIADEAYRMEPHSLEMLYMLNTEHLVQHPTLLYMANSLNMVREHKAVFLARHDTAAFMVDKKIDAVVSHQWNNNQNYLYLDILYGNYPLIHNSDWLREAGYYYPDFEIQEGADQLLNACANHVDNIECYAKQAQKYFDQTSIEGEHNIETYAELLKSLCLDRPGWVGGGV